MKNHTAMRRTSAAVAAAALAGILGTLPAQAMRAPEPPAEDSKVIPGQATTLDGGIQLGQVAAGATVGLLLAGVGAAAARTRRGDGHRTRRA